METIPNEQAQVLQISKELIEILHTNLKRISQIKNIQWEIKISPDKWSKKEILGHLIDSASNNHQRFVRAQIDNILVISGYEQDQWVKVQNYQNVDVNQLIQFWYAYNLHIFRVISNTKANKLDIQCFIGNNEPVTLLWLIEDYVKHLKHHLKQI